MRLIGGRVCGGDEIGAERLGHQQTARLLKGKNFRVTGRTKLLLFPMITTNC